MAFCGFEEDGEILASVVEIGLEKALGLEEWKAGMCTFTAFFSLDYVVCLSHTFGFAIDTPIAKLRVRGGVISYSSLLHQNGDIN